MIGLDASNVNSEMLYRLQLPKVDFVILKATEGVSFVDKTHGPRANEARAANRLVGHYHFDRSNDDGAQQATFFLSIAQPLSGETLWLDMETEDAQSWGAVASRAATFLRTIYASTGATCGLYSNRSELVAVLAAATPADRAILEAAPLWFADPDHPAGRPLCPTPWAIHQYGAVGGLDANVTSQSFNWGAMAVPANHTPSAPVPAPQPQGDGDMTPQQDAELTATNQAVGRLEVAVEDPTSGLRKQVADLTVLVKSIATKLGA